MTSRLVASCIVAGTRQMSMVPKTPAARTVMVGASGAVASLPQSRRWPNNVSPVVNRAARRRDPGAWAGSRGRSSWIRDADRPLVHATTVEE
jgi:hypothetical protein